MHCISLKTFLLKAKLNLEYSADENYIITINMHAASDYKKYQFFSLSQGEISRANKSC